MSKLTYRQQQISILLELEKDVLKREKQGFNLFFDGWWGIRKEKKFIKESKKRMEITIREIQTIGSVNQE